MEKDKLEHSIKSKLSSYESAVNTDNLWAGIQAGMTEAATGTAVSSASATAAKGGILTSLISTKWILGLSVVGLIGIAAIFYFQSQHQNKQSEPFDQRSTPNTTHIASTSATSSSNKEYVGSEEIKKTGHNRTSNNSDIASSNVNSNPIEGVVSKNSESSLENTSHSTSSTMMLPQNEPSKESSPLGVNPTSNPSSHQTSEEFPSTNESNISSSSVAQESTVTKIGDTKNETQVELATEVANQSTELEELSTSKTSLVYSNSLENMAHFNLTKMDATTEFIGSLPPNKVTCPSFGGGSRGGLRGYFVGEVQAIPYYSIPRITALSEEGELWKQNKLETEKYLETFQVNAVGRYQTNSGLYVHGGVGYGQLDEKFDINLSQTITTVEDLPVIIIIRPDGMNDTIPAPLEVTQDSMALYSTYNYHRMVEFTAAVGYEIALNSALAVYGDIGMSVNLYTSRSGYHIVDNVDVVSFDERPVFKTSTGYKLTGGLGLRYYTENRVVLSGGIDFRSHLSNWIRDEHPIELRYTDIGLRLGVGYVF